MSKIVKPRNNEIILQDDDLIVSKTCLKGTIRYANRKFMTISGFSELELLGKPHNMIRHPDMPRGVFRMMWQNLKQNDEFFGFVKNLCADGSYYWVFANITPDMNTNGEIQGYYSVRRKPPAQAVHQVIEPLYQKMLSIEAQGRGPDVLEQSVQQIHTWLQKLDMDYGQAMITLYQQGQLTAGDSR